MTQALRTRIIPCLLLQGDSLVKTVKFGNPQYVGDPINTVRIFNELEVDELMLLDISCARSRAEPNMPLLAQIANECFMPMSYGGGVRTIEHVTQILRIGFEKVAINTAALEDEAFGRQAADKFGAQSIIFSIDVKKSMWGRYSVRGRGGSRKTGLSPVDWACKAQALGAGELLLTSIDREGTWSGFDIDLLSSVTQAVSVPVIASGGAGKVGHIAAAINTGGASAVALGSMVVFQSKGLGVLVNFPDKEQIAKALER